MKKYYDCKTKEELFAVIRQATREGYFFRVENYYQNSNTNRAGYMVYILSNKND
jgi:hypothetical protein